jgi:hypothetical protein
VKEIAKAKNTHLKYSHTIDSFISHLGGRAKLSIAVVSSKDIASFRDAQIASGKASKHGAVSREAITDSLQRSAASGNNHTQSRPRQPPLAKAVAQNNRAIAAAGIIAKGGISAPPGKIVILGYS